MFIFIFLVVRQSFVGAFFSQSSSRHMTQASYRAPELSLCISIKPTYHPHVAQQQFFVFDVFSRMVKLFFE